MRKGCPLGRTCTLRVRFPPVHPRNYDGSSSHSTKYRTDCIQVSTDGQLQRVCLQCSRCTSSFMGLKLPGRVDGCVIITYTTTLVPQGPFAVTSPPWLTIESYHLESRCQIKSARMWKSTILRFSLDNIYIRCRLHLKAGDAMLEKQTYVFLHAPRGPVKVTVARKAGQLVYRIYKKL